MRGDYRFNTALPFRIGWSKVEMTSNMKLIGHHWSWLSKGSEP